MVGDLTFSVLSWDVANNLLLQQPNNDGLVVDVIIVIGIPRHHAKKLIQQAWTKDYYLSKETRTLTLQHRTSMAAPQPITLVFCKYPFYSEQWLPISLLAQDKETTTSLVHVVEVCIPMNAWQANRSPIHVLQEYQVSYEDVSIVTFVVAQDISHFSQVSQTFSDESSVVFVAPSSSTSGFQIETQFHFWKLDGMIEERNLISLTSTLV